jgi:Fe-S oxidoreductase
MHVPTVAELVAQGKSPEILFWVGCAGSFDQRAQRVTKAFAQILDQVQINYAAPAIRPAEQVMNFYFR